LSKFELSCLSGREELINIMAAFMPPKITLLVVFFVMLIAVIPLTTTSSSTAWRPVSMTRMSS
jgi:hypothetical protein